MKNWKGRIPSSLDNLFWYELDEKKIATAHSPSIAKLLSMLLNSIKDLGFGLGHIIQIAQSLQGLDEKEKKQLQEALLKHSITVFLHWNSLLITYQKNKKWGSLHFMPSSIALGCNGHVAFMQQILTHYGGWVAIGDHDFCLQKPPESSKTEWKTQNHLSYCECFWKCLAVFQEIIVSQRITSLDNQ